MSEKKSAPLYQNMVSYVGLLMMIGAGMLIFFALIVQFSVERQSPYVGIFTYLIFPTFMLAGLVLVLYGMRWEALRRKRDKRLDRLPYPNINFNDPKHRRILGYVLVSGTFFGTIAAAALYKGYLFTESVEFCGTVCHQPMEPEYTAYLTSPHARVPCVECHVGEGAGWYMRSKLSGARQVLAVALNSYARPIATPIEHLRPARETCERCHWPEKFFGAKLLQLPHYRYNEENTAEQISLTLKTGGGSKSHGASTGIHWHMVIANKIRYVTTDKQHLDIPVVRVEHPDGSVEEYVDRNNELSKTDIDKLEVHQMDCMDCHNRPTHNFPPPDAGIDEAIYRGLISQSLPSIKRVAVEAMTNDYVDRPTAHRQVRKLVLDFYGKHHPEVLKARKSDIEKAINAVNAVYDRSVFPEMNVDWRTYPSHIGHRYWPGCFRCHDGQHVTKTGKVLANDCSSTCHTMPVRGSLTSLGVAGEKSHDNWHAWDWSPEYVQIKAHQTLICSDCHRAGERPYTDCGDCH